MAALVSPPCTKTVTTIQGGTAVMTALEEAGIYNNNRCTPRTDTGLCLLGNGRYMSVSQIHVGPLGHLEDRLNGIFSILVA
jgi:hypothetical protein